MPANELVSPMDPRMPVVVSEDTFSDWLDPDTNRATKVLTPLELYPSERMECWPVSTRVNSPAEDDAGLIVPIPLPQARNGQPELTQGTT
jgi:putative SOS response-associated peptidase YedK